MSLAERLALPPVPVVQPREHPQAPKGWEPGVTWQGTAGTVTTPLMRQVDPSTGWDDLLTASGLDPAKYRVDESSVIVRHDPAAWVRHETHDAKGYRMPATTEPVTRYRFSVRLRPAQFDRADVERMIAQIGKRKPAKTAKVASAVHDRALVVCCSDWQMGKGEGGGSVATVERIEQAIAELPRVIKRLKPAVVYVVGMGDLVENCQGHYAAQTWSVDLDRREQMRVVRRLLLHLVDTVAPLVSRVVLGAVPGNHGENRNGDGKAYTTQTDNDDLAVVEQVAEILAANPERYGHVFTILADSLTLALDVAGVTVAFRHGHGGKGAGKVVDWWRGQVMGRELVADAQILVTAHFHHLIVDESSGRTWLQCPAMDGGSAWFTQNTGQHSPPGLLTFAVGTAYGPRGWGDLEIVGGQ